MGCVNHRIQLERLMMRGQASLAPPVRLRLLARCRSRHLELPGSPYSPGDHHGHLSTAGRLMRTSSGVALPSLHLAVSVCQPWLQEPASLNLRLLGR